MVGEFDECAVSTELASESGSMKWILDEMLEE
jgi:hypothetical protein